MDYYNQRWRDYADLKSEPADASGWDVFLHANDLKAWVEGWKHAVRVGDPFEFTCRLRCAATGLYRWHLARAVPIRSAQGVVEGWLGTATDIHARQEAFRQMLESQSSIDTAGDEANDVSGVVGLAMDMTENKKLQDEQTNLIIEKKTSNALKQSEAKLKEANVALSASAEAKSQFLANMSHEIRTPINGVIGATGLLLDTALDREQKEFAETILGSANMLLVLVNDILDFSKIEAGHMGLELVDFNFVNLLSDVEKSLRVEASKKGLKIRILINDELPTSIIRTDSTRLRQILTNLVGNAIKFTSIGHVDISVYLLGSEDDKIQLQIEVTDTGVGIAESARDRLFKVFSQADASTTRRYGGTGLGLSICKHLVALLGGQIGVVSVEGQGSTFWFTIAVESGSAANLAANADGEKTVRPAARHIRVLLAEDNLVNQKIATTMLQKCGYDVDVASNGRQALDALQKTHYDLVLMDCQMPEMDGYEATTHIRNSPDAYRTIPIIAMTANAMAGDREKCLRAGMTDYIAKPIRLNYLKDVIEKVISAYKTAS